MDRPLPVDEPAVPAATAGKDAASSGDTGTGSSDESGIAFRRMTPPASGTTGMPSIDASASASGPPPGFSMHLGAALEQLAASGNPRAVRFPVPLRSAAPNPSLAASTAAGTESAKSASLSAAKSSAHAGSESSSTGSLSNSGGGSVRRAEVKRQLQSSVCSFSFSGLKSSVARFMKTIEQTPTGTGKQGSGSSTSQGLNGEALQSASAVVSPRAASLATASPQQQPCPRPADIAASFQATVVRHLTDQLTRALEHCRSLSSPADSTDISQADGTSTGTGMPPVSQLVVCGGVAANKAVRSGVEDVASSFGAKAVFPPLHLCADNGVMIAWTGAQRVAAVTNAARHAARMAGWAIEEGAGPLAAAGLDEPRTAASSQTACTGTDTRSLLDLVHPDDLRSLGIYPSCTATATAPATDVASASASALDGGGPCPSPSAGPGPQTTALAGGPATAQSDRGQRGHGATCTCSICALDVDPRWQVVAGLR